MITLTKEIIYAAGQDAATARMRKAGRKHWDKDDYETAVATVERLAACVCPQKLREWGWCEFIELKGTA